MHITVKTVYIWTMRLLSAKNQTGQLSGKIVLQCESCCYKTSRLRPCKARQRLASHVASHSNVQKEPKGPTEVHEGLDSEGDNSVPEAGDVGDNGGKMETKSGLLQTRIAMAPIAMPCEVAKKLN